MKKQLLTSSIFLFLERAIVVITSLMLTPYLISVLGTSDYGLWLLVLSIMGWFNVVDLGFPQAVQRQIIQALEIKDNHRVNVVFSTGLVLFAILGFLSVLALISLTQVPAIFGITGPDQLTLVQILLVLSVKVFWGFLMNPFHGFFSGLLRFDIDANLSSLNAIVKALLVFWLIADLNIWGAVVATLASDVITNILKVIYAKRLFPSLSFSLKLASIVEIKALFAYSKHLVLNGIILTIGSKSEPMIITRLFDLSSLAIQQIAANLIMHAQAFVGTITGVFGPVYNKMAAKKQDMEKIFIQTTTINIFITSVMFTCLLMFGKIFIILWVGDEFEYATYILYFSVFSILCSSFTTSANSILMAQANHKLLSLISFFIVLFNIPMAIYLGLEFGLIGLAMAGSLSNLIFNVFVKMTLFKHYNNYKTREVYKRLAMSIFLVYSLGFIGSSLLESLAVDTWLELVLSATAAFPFIVLICWVLLLTPKLKGMIFILLVDKIKPKKKIKPS
ncbi:oligosaccharide flippase family protein [Colwellia sp. Bg11-12]|uniref:oligosaccharide flippase family protein n=1 Tax=Colwellia sp. Bg11-12 TaxID=2759817 RepID=UPI0015F72DF5|nr:oligosaccharide flippase family protein [Colwellia sp. Bg11-12]MBA6265144.1 oligosaccharide flippase family protein [Colwellia sp. Bg11-12]